MLGVPVYVPTLMERLPDLAEVVAPFEMTVQGAEDLVEWAPVQVEGAEFEDALRVSVSRAGDLAYEAEVKSAPTLEPVGSGQVVVATFAVRTIEADDETGEGRMSAFVQRSGPDYDTFASADVSAGRDWRRYWVAGIAEQDWDAGALELTLHVASLRQTFEVGGFAMFKLPADTDLASLPNSQITYAGRELDAPWRADAQARIEEHRMAPIEVRVVDGEGNPVVGESVRIQQRRHAFQFGSALFEELLDHPQAETYQEWALRMFNKATIPVYAADWGWQRPERRDGAKRLAQFFEERDVDVKAHVLVWPSWRWSPTYWREMSDDPDALRTEIQRHVREVVSTMEPYGIEEYDVMNEPRVNRDLMDLMGREVMKDWFDITRELDPDAKLFFNDYAILTGGGRTETNQQIFEAQIRELQELGAPLDAIGFQGHFGQAPTDPERLIEILDRFATFGLPIQITEFDHTTLDLELQRDYLRDFYTAVFSHPGVEGITMWGFWEGEHWRPQAALFREDFTIKPNGEEYLRLVYDEWWTDLELLTDADGMATVRGFMGDYLVSSGQASAEVEVGEAGAVITLKLP